VGLYLTRVIHFNFLVFQKGGKLCIAYKQLLLPCRGVATGDMSTHLSIAINH